MNVTMRYCEGWDWAAGRAIGWLTGADAFAADCAGRPYTVLVAPADGPAVVIDVAWEADYLAVSRMDGEGRLAARTVYRRMREGELFPVRDEEWRFGPGERTGDPGVWHEKVEREPGGRTRVSTGRGAHGSGVTVDTVAVDALWRTVPRFGEWHPFTPFPPGGFAAVLEPTGGSQITGSAPWRPLSAGPERYLDALVAREVEGEEIGTLRLSSGRVAVGDPARVGAVAAPVVTVTPGEYRVEQVAVSGVPVAAIVWFTGAEVATWESAGEREGAMGCFVDAADAAALGEAIEASEGVLDGVHDGAHEIWIDGEEVSLVAFAAPGGHRVWIGRDAGGRAVCCLSDLRVAPPHG
ncbi:hypothetical protein Afil01_47850 [Actinorhabdospora filicis]|uniref:DUF4241 domain-containing protein n=1 Tax=Actinorhabdospora filicis TaxID=1785913 RepID=A0A9W6SPY5_9ACTN|nr:hypothetical protein [Actinorhabdospora filicis]GLZ79978.1 hypothetical protein Afil01_47850 [Actinorhabdospora filicis]